MVAMGLGKLAAQTPRPKSFIILRRTKSKRLLLHHLWPGLSKIPTPGAPDMKTSQVYPVSCHHCSLRRDSNHRVGWRSRL
jgi:hypothetical protein